MTHQHNYFQNNDQSTIDSNINNDLIHLSRKYHKYSQHPFDIDDKKSNYYTELLESKDYKIQELELNILSLRDEIEYMKYSLNDKIENIKMEHKKELFLLHKQHKEYIKNYVKIQQK